MPPQVCAESKKTKHIETESELVVVRVLEAGGNEEMLIKGFQLPVIRGMNKFWGSMYSMVTRLNNTILYI